MYNFILFYFLQILVSFYDFQIEFYKLHSFVIAFSRSCSLHFGGGPYSRVRRKDAILLVCMDDMQESHFIAPHRGCFKRMQVVKLKLKRVI